MVGKDEFYREAVQILRDSGIPFLVGGAFAFGQYTGITRHTKDLDLYLRREHVAEAVRTYSKSGFRAEITFSHWLAKVFFADQFIDLIFGSGNGLCTVDENWFEHAVTVPMFGVDVLLTPIEELIWQKAYIMERERFDGADVIHMIRRCGPQINWGRLLARFGEHWRLLLSHLILFNFVFPNDRSAVPRSIWEDLTERFQRALATPADAAHECLGTLLSRTQYLADAEELGFADPRLRPTGTMTTQEIAVWTNAGC